MRRRLESIKFLKTTKQKESLYDIYRSSYLHSTHTWRYYENRRRINPFIFNSNFVYSFIHNYFNDGGKSLLIRDIYKLPDIRLYHTVSCFFLGIYVCNFLGVNRKKKFRPSFKYLWFLSCLYHDFGYIYENDATEVMPTIDYNMFDRLDIPSELADFFDIETIQNYNHYRNDRDHGIIGGLLLYNNLVTNFHSLVPDGTERIIDVENGQLHFSREHFNYYKEAALNIMLHNIWLCTNKKDEAKYKRFGLKKLVGKKYQFTYSISMMFILLLADTIEPLKRYCENNESTNYEEIEYILKNVFIERTNDSIIISSNIIEDIGNFRVESWLDGICSMENWINIKIEKESNSIKIYHPLL